MEAAVLSKAVCSWQNLWKPGWLEAFWEAAHRLRKASDQVTRDHCQEIWNYLEVSRRDVAWKHQQCCLNCHTNEKWILSEKGDSTKERSKAVAEGRNHSVDSEERQVEAPIPLGKGWSCTFGIHLERETVWRCQNVQSFSSSHQLSNVRDQEKPFTVVRADVQETRGRGN